MNIKVSERVTEDIITEWVNRLAVIRHRMQEKGDDASGEKMWQLIRKAQKREFSIGFCGHFSAGKSSMINELWNESLLPSSPIPTSANLVKVRTGEPWARVYFKNRDPVQFAYPYDINKVKAYCLDGDEVDSVEISHPSEHFPNQVAILDTPGIDSTDDAHRVATTSSLHLADVVFYVMDYNHVQSELNFHFAKEIKEQGKRLYFVINQIDKHHEGELPFSEFKRGVKMAFNHWNIDPDGIFYTSLMQQIDFNELDELKQFIQSLIEKKDELFISNIQKASATIINEHMQWIQAKHEENREQFQTTIASADVSRVKEDYENALHRKEKLEGKLEHFEQEIKIEIANILKNAILMPFETRDLAKQYLEANEENFKVGFLFSKNKTEQERQRRMDAFYTNFMEKVTSQLDWHIKQLLVEQAKQNEINDNTLFTSIYDEDIDIPIEILSEQIKTGASVNGDYLLKYAEDVADEAKKIYRAFAFKMVDKLLARLRSNVNDELKELKTTIEQNEGVIRALEAEKRLQQAEQHIYEQFHSILLEKSTISSAEVADALSSLPADPQVTIVHDEEEINASQQISERELQSQPNHHEKSVREPNPIENVEETINKLKLFAHEVSEIKGFTTIAKEMQERANRLEHQRYTVALFGAFSAGKSSFANALIGHPVLPVSPNPTTATINKIMPVDEKHRHGTVVVKMKSEKDLFHDIETSMKFLDESIESLQSVEKKIATIHSENLQPKAKPHYAFLKAVEKGIEFYRKRAGKEFVISLDEFQSFVAQEEKACFVEWVELYYDCSFTRQGITLVDTPGADSINARHTGVAFEYIKNADAILFVTYYNHAFSHADKDFLTQLGRVKDVFELDKMFFIVNAADLAKSDEELSLVLTHVENNLLQHQIRKPRIFPISSQVALLSRLGKSGEITDKQYERLKELLHENESEKNGLFEKGFASSKIETFERAFHQFIHVELTSTAVAAAKTEMTRTIATLHDWLSSAKQGEEVRLQQRKETEKTRKSLVELIETIHPTSEKQALLQEIEELFYYVKQRLFLRFNDRFQEAFNPAVLQIDKRSIKEKLKISLQQLVDSIEFDLVQEMRATSLRVEAFLRKQVTAVFKQAEDNIHNLVSAKFLHSFELGKIEIPNFQESFYSLNIQSLYPLLAMFKNPKQFFEHNGQIEMREVFEDALQQPVDHYLQVNFEQFKTYYENEFSCGIKAMQKQLEKEIEDYCEGKLSVLSATVDLEHLETTYNKIKAL